MTLRIISVLAILFSFLQAAAQFTASAPGSLQEYRSRIFAQLSGRIVDSLSGQPLAGASIYFTEARIGTIAGADGRYVLNNVPAGHHLVEISHAGYNTIVDHIDVSGNLERNFAMVPSITENQGVTVTGVTNASIIRHTPIPVTLVKRSELLHTAATNIIDALSKEPGLAQVSTGPGISKPVIRGLGYNRVVVINDGIRQEGQQWGDEHGIEIDESSVQRAEIVKGPASITYGSDALAGVVHFITHVPVAEGSIKGNLLTGYQTNNRQYTVHGNIAGNRNGFNWNTYGSIKSAGDYKNRWDGNVLNSRFGEKNFGGYLGLNKSWGFSHLIFSSFHQKLGLIEGERDDASGAFLAYPESPLEHIATEAEAESRNLMVPSQDVQHYRLVLDNSFNIRGQRLKLNLGFQNNLRREFGDAENPEEAELFFDLKTLNYTAQWIFKEHREWQTSVGLNGMWQDNRNRGAEFIIPDYNLVDAGAYFFAQKLFSKLSLSTGIRYDHRSVQAAELWQDGAVKFNSLDKSFSNFSGTAGISLLPSDAVTIKLNLARGFRAPVLSELASNGAHEGTNRYEYGQPDLRSEKSLQGDAGVQLDYQHISFSVNAFYNNINDFIFYRRLESQLSGDSMVTVDGEELEAFRYSQEDARLKGFEISADLHPHPLDWLHFENSLSLVRGTFSETIDGSRNLPMIPAARWISELRFDMSRIGPALQNIYLHLEMEKTWAQQHPFTGYNTETATPGYTLFHTGLGAEIRSNKRVLANLHVALNNITDKAYQSHLSRLKYAELNAASGRKGVFNMGRNFSFRVNIPFGK